LAQNVRFNRIITDELSINIKMISVKNQEYPARAASLASVTTTTTTTTV